MLDVGTQVPHGAVRGVRDGGAGRQERARDRRRHRSDGARSCARASKPARSASRPVRTIAHMAIDGEPVPGTFAAEDELFGIGRVLGELGTGVFELAPAGALGEDLAAPEREMAWMRKLVGRDRPAGHVRAHAERPRSRVVAAHARAVRARPRPRARRCGRRSRAGPVSLLLGLADVPPVRVLPVVGADRRRDRSRRRSRAMRDPETAAPAAGRGRRRRSRRCASSSIPSAAFPIGAVPDYEPAPRAQRRRHRARAQGRAADGGVLRRADGGRRPRARDAPAAQLHRLLPRRGARDAAAPDERVGPRRRRRALRHHVRREHAHVHAHALGARPRRTTGCRSSGSCGR